MSNYLTHFCLHIGALFYGLFRAHLDSQKTAEDRAREELLLREVVEVVNERNEIVQELDYQEQA